MRARNVRNAERLTEHTVRLEPLKVGDRVFIQKETGIHPLRWDRTGLVIEVKQFDLYAVRVDGSGRKTVRNRKFLRKFDKIFVDHLPGTTHTIQPLKTPNNAENLSPVNQRTNPEQAGSDRCTVYTTSPRDTDSYNKSPTQVQLPFK